jgi:ubiquinone/menaquinone biosynthesis C-methylase UbiE
VAAARERLPGVRVERATTEAMPFEGGRFHATLAHLVVHFMADPLAGLREMRRVTPVTAQEIWIATGSVSTRPSARCGSYL